jgi:glycosyltransferase involved in cell wall biosynthesis
MILDSTLHSKAPKLSIVLPVYNDRQTIEEVLRRVQAVAIDKEIIIVDDGSQDGTRELLGAIDRAASWHGVVFLPLTNCWLRADNVCVLFQPENRGKGAAVSRGFSSATGEVVIVQDADLGLDPQDYFKLLEPIEEGRADVVYGSRYLTGPVRGIRCWQRWGNRLLTQLSNRLTKLRLSDVWAGYKALRREVAQSIELRANGFGFEQEVKTRIARAGWRVCEVPISYPPRKYSEGKKLGWRDGLQGIWQTIRYSVWT